MIFYSYEEFKEDVKILAKEIKEDFNPDALLAIARGGMSLGHSLAVALQTRKLFALNSIHYDDTKNLILLRFLIFLILASTKKFYSLMIL